MSRFISALLSKEKTAIRSTISKLELASGESSIDSRMISEIVIKTKAKIKQLGLDSDDSTPDEIYTSLINLAHLHDGFLAKSLGATDSSDVQDLIPRITKFANNIAKTKTVWAVKHAVAKRQIKEVPPKALMKKLGYRSLESMLKREKIDDLFAGIRAYESSEYITKFFNSFSKLHPSDFESRKLTVSYLSQSKWQKVTQDFVSNTRSNIIELKELGSVVVLPIPVKKLQGVSITVLPLILHKLNNIHLYSSYFKFEQVQYNFGEILSDALLDRPRSNANMVGLDLSWNIVRDHFGKLAQTGDTDVFEPHIQIEDLQKNSVEESLYKFEPALHFWFGNDCLGLPYETGIVSFNLMDVATSFVNKLNFGVNSTKYLAESLWDELLVRYLNESPLHEQVLTQLDSQTAGEEFDEQGMTGTAFA